MKTLKRLLSVFAVFAMVLTMTVSANAATVTVDSKLDGHTFGYYQILKGTQVAGDPSLGTPAWGSGIDVDDFLAELDDIVVFSTVTDAASFAKALAANTSYAEQVARIAFNHKVGEPTTIAAGTTTIDAGYYLIVDTTTLSTGDAKNAALLQITEKDNIEIGYKTTKPTIEKTVNGKKLDDAYIGENLVMELTATIPSMKDFTTYKVIFTDDAQDSFAAPSNIAIKLVGKSTGGVADTEVAVTSAVVNVTAPDFTITIDDVKDLAVEGNLNVNEEVKVVVTYNTSLNAAADLGNPGNANKVKLTYSAEPNTDETNDTAEKIVYVFTYELDGTKVNGNKTSETLPGATFKLKNSAGQYYSVTAGIVSWVASEDDATVLTSGDNGLFRFSGVDTGTYTLVEVTPPTGYNKADDTEITITAEYSETAITKLAIGTQEFDVTKGKVNVEVKNYKGATLPETGGMGTTLFYVIGAALVLGAGVVLVSKKRMAAK